VSSDGARPNLAYLLLVRLAHFFEQLQRLAGLLIVDPLQGEAEVDEHPISDLCLGTERDRDRTANTGDLGLGQSSLGIDDLDDLRRDR
jgi:hypothetical protein